MTIAIQIPKLTQSDRKYMRGARSAGCTLEQFVLFYLAKYSAQPKQLEFHAACREADDPDGPFWILFGGARGPGKSHAAMAQVGLDDCQRYAGLKFLFLRKIQKAAAESFEDLVARIFGKVDHTYTTSDGRITFPNGSRIMIGGYKDESDIDKYIGIEYDGVVVEELTQISEQKIIAIRGSVRTAREDWRPRVYASTNPGGVGHLSVKTHFVIPWRRNKKHKFVGGLTRFIPATYKDNRFLDAGYVEYLEALPGPLGKAWREGDWESFEGMAFPHWVEEDHVIEPFPIPLHWPKWRAYDWGFDKPMCCLWITKDVVRKRTYVYRELYQSGLDDDEQAQTILEMTPKEENITATYADPSIWNERKWVKIMTTIADELTRQGLFLLPADNSRISGKRKINNALGYNVDGLPKLQIFSTCENLIRTLPSLPVDDHNTEDVDTDAEDHAYDALRYGLTNTQLQAPTQTTSTQRSPLEIAGGIL